MENNKLQKVIFMLLRILGIVSIIGGFLGEEMLNRYNTKVVGHMVFISPILIVEMIVTIILYRMFIAFLEKHISITKKVS